MYRQEPKAGEPIYRLNLRAGTAVKVGTFVRFEDAGYSGSDLPSYDSTPCVVVSTEQGERKLRKAEHGTEADAVWIGLEIQN